VSITSRSFIETARHTELVFGTDAVLTVLTILHCVAKKVGYFQNNGTSLRVPVPGPEKNFAMARRLPQLVLILAPQREVLNVINWTVVGQTGICVGVVTL